MPVQYLKHNLTFNAEALQAGVIMMSKAYERAAGQSPELSAEIMEDALMDTAAYLLGDEIARLRNQLQDRDAMLALAVRAVTALDKIEVTLRTGQQR